MVTNTFAFNASEKYMMIRSLLLLSILVSIGGLNAQHFSFSPDRLHEESVSASQYTDHTIYIENLTGGELILGWELLSVDFPSAWEADLCDYIGCYIGIPDTGIMNPISDTIQAYLKITINPNDSPGTGMAVFKVFDNKHPDEVDTCTFIVHATEVTSIAHTTEHNLLEVFPIPASDFMHVQYDIDKTGNLQLFDLQGRLLLYQETEGKRNSKISLSNIPAGVYALILTQGKTIIDRKKILIQ